MKCKYTCCDREVPVAPGGHRAREFCSNAHKQAFYRQQHGMVPVQSDQTDQALLADLQRELQEAHDRITHLEQQLDVEKRFLRSDIHAFKRWLKKQPRSELPDMLGPRLLQEDWLPPRASRAVYESNLRTAGYSPEEITQFRDLWRRMLLDMPYERYS